MTVNDADMAFKIWGANIVSLKGKTMHHTPDAVAINVVGIPRKIRNLHKIVTLSMDIFFVNAIPFLLTLSHNLCFTTITHLADRTIKSMYKAFKGIFTYYLQRGFQITVITADGEFAPLQQLMVELPGSPTLNLASASEHESGTL